MKTNLFSIVMISFLLSSCGGNRYVGDFYREYKHEKNTVNIALPGWLIWLGTGIANEFVNEPEAKAGMEIAKKVKGLRILVMEDKNTVDRKDINKLVSKVQKQDFDEWIYVKEGKTSFNFLIREKDNMIRNILILVSEEDEFVMVSMKSKIKYKDLKKLIKQFGKELKVEEPLKKLPQA